MIEQDAATARRKEWEATFGKASPAEDYFADQIIGYGRPAGGVIAEMDLMLSLGVMPKPEQS